MSEETPCKECGIEQGLVRCAKINFENFERAVPAVRIHPYYTIAKAQLDEACGDGTVQEKLDASPLMPKKGSP